MSAIHSHMSNTRNTPVEILERTYPITIEEYRWSRTRRAPAVTAAAPACTGATSCTSRPR